MPQPGPWSDGGYTLRGCQISKAFSFNLNKKEICHSGASTPLQADFLSRLASRFDTHELQFHVASSLTWTGGQISFHQFWPHIRNELASLTSDGALHGLSLNRSVQSSLDDFYVSAFAVNTDNEVVNLNECVAYLYYTHRVLVTRPDFLETNESIALGRPLASTCPHLFQVSGLTQCFSSSFHTLLSLCTIVNAPVCAVAHFSWPDTG